MEDPIGRLHRKRATSITEPPRFASHSVAAIAGTGRGSGFKPRCEQCKRPVLSEKIEVKPTLGIHPSPAPLPFITASALGPPPSRPGITGSTTISFINHIITTMTAIHVVNTTR